MKGRQVAIVLTAFLGGLGTQALRADDDNRAVPRGGGSSDGGGGHASHSSGGSSGGSSSGSSASGSSSSSSSSGGDSYAVGAGHHSSSSHSRPSASGRRGSSGGDRQPTTDAQRRHPRAGTGTGGFRNGRYNGRYNSGYYYPYDSFYWGYGYYMSPFYFPRYYGYGYWDAGYGYGGYGGYGGGYYPRYHYDRSGSVRVLVEPRETNVYVDGYYAGQADDFDGIFQRLNLTRGRHDLTLKLEGYQSHQIKLYVPYDHTIKVRHKMVPGPGDQISEQTVGDPRDSAPEKMSPPPYADNGDDDDDADVPDVSREREPAPRRDREPPMRGERGALRLDVQPSDASIYVDGVFRGTGQDLRRLNLPEGKHRLEVVRPGYRTLERDVQIQAGATEEVDIDLPRS